MGITQPDRNLFLVYTLFSRIHTLFTWASLGKIPIVKCYRVGWPSKGSWPQIYLYLVICLVCDGFGPVVGQESCNGSSGGGASYKRFSCFKEGETSLKKPRVSLERDLGPDAKIKRERDLQGIRGQSGTGKEPAGSYLLPVQVAKPLRRNWELRKGEFNC